MGDFGAHQGWCQLRSDVDEVKQLTHDRLVELMGPNRIGPVRWRVSSGAVAIAELDAMSKGEKAPGLALEYAEMRRRLKSRGGFLVTAFARGQRTDVAIGRALAESNARRPR